jgi:hypothetical protein
MGRDRIGAAEALGRQAPRELGPIWISIEPEFSTRRRVLGIHLDPSAGRNWNSGAAGCSRAASSQRDDDPVGRKVVVGL